MSIGVEQLWRSSAKYWVQSRRSFFLKAKLPLDRTDILLDIEYCYYVECTREPNEEELHTLTWLLNGDKQLTTESTLPTIDDETTLIEV